MATPSYLSFREGTLGGRGVSATDHNGFENYAAFSGVTSATAAVRFSVSDGLGWSGGRSLEWRKMEFNSLNIPEGGLRDSSARLLNQLRTSPMVSQIPNTKSADTIRKTHHSDAGIASVNSGKTLASCSSISRLRGDFVVEVLFIRRFPLG